MNAPSEPPLARLVRRTLQFGIALAVLLLAIGLTAAVALGQFGPSALVGVASPRAVFAGSAGAIGESLILAGVLALVATPIARVAVSLGWFAHARDLTYAAITAFVLTVLGLTIWIGLAL